MSEENDPITRTEKPFIIGLTMAGAVSAGAYSAGVFDFLMEALNEWQTAKDRGDPDVPRHDVLISAISGASAGGITGALGLLAAASGIQPGSEPASPPLGGSGRAAMRPTDQGMASVAARTAAAGGSIRRAMPILYDAWVKGPRFVAERESRGGAFLATTDVTSGAPLRSLLDSSLLNSIAETAVDGFRPTGRRHAFFTDPVHLFLTLTNLDGVPYVMPFSANASAGHFMINHADRVHYAVHGIGGRPFPDDTCQWLSRWGDTGRPLDLSQALTPDSEDRHHFIEAVLGTSAFPFGLRPREITARAEDYERRAWPIEDSHKGRMARPIVPAWPSAHGWRGEATHFVAVDGGATDNQPFELARWTIRDLDQAANTRDSRLADRAVIMIDPFGEGQPFDIDRIRKERKDDLVLSYVLKALIPALTNQARFKLTDLVQANDEHTYSRFLISPVRSVDGVGMRPAVASESFRAFGGFIDQRFREHDFQLGRRNCQNFLRRHFVLHKDNPVFRGAYRTDAVDPFYKQSGEDEVAGTHRPIIPLVGSARVPCPAPVWPQMEETRLDTLEKAIRLRLDTLVHATINSALPYALWNWSARWIWRRFKRDQVIELLQMSVASALYRSGQLAVLGPDGSPVQAPNAAVNLVTSALADPSWDFRTVDGILRQQAAECGHAGGTATLVERTDVERALTALGRRIVKAPARSGAPPAYTLARRKRWLRNPVWRWLSNPDRWRYDDAPAKPRG